MVALASCEFDQEPGAGIAIIEGQPHTLCSRCLGWARFLAKLIQSKSA